MPPDALLANASEIVPVGAIDSKMRVADAVRANLALQLLRKTRSAVRRCQKFFGVEQRERAFLLRKLGRRFVRRVAHRACDVRRHAASRVAVVAQAEHRQRIAKSGEAESDAALVRCLVRLFLQRPQRCIEHVVERARRDFGNVAEFVEVERRLLAERIVDELRQIDRAEAAAAVRRQGLLAAGIRRGDRFDIRQIVVLVDAVDKDHARFGMVVGRPHDLIEQLASTGLAVHPRAIRALIAVRRVERLGRVPEFDLAIAFDRAHERIGDSHRHVEVGQRAVALGVDEFFDVRVITAQHAHLCAAPRTGGFQRLAALVEHAHVGDRPACARMRAVHARALRADRREVVTDAAAAPHGFGRLIQRQIYRGHAVVDAADRVADRLHEAIDQRRGDAGACCRVDAAARNEAVDHRFVEALLPRVTQLGFLDLRKTARNAAAHFVDRLLVALGVLFEQYVDRNGLLVEQQLGLVKLHESFVLVIAALR